MRYLYGLIAGILLTTFAGILYLAIAGGEYLLRLSPEVHQMRSRLTELERVERDRSELAGKLESLESRFRQLAERFEQLASQRAEEPETVSAESTRGSSATTGGAPAREKPEENDSAGLQTDAPES